MKTFFILLFITVCIVFTNLLERKLNKNKTYDNYNNEDNSNKNDSHEEKPDKFKKIFKIMDTSWLMNNRFLPSAIRLGSFNSFEIVNIPAIVLKELEGLAQNPEKAEKAKKALEFVQKCKDDYMLDIIDFKDIYKEFIHPDLSYADKIVLSFAKKRQLDYPDYKVVLYTTDKLMAEVGIKNSLKVITPRYYKIENNEEFESVLPICTDGVGTDTLDPIYEGIYW